MATVTNFAAGPRGLNLDGGGTLWVEPGQSVELSGSDKSGYTVKMGDDDRKITGKLPDFGKEGEAPPKADAEVSDLKDQIAALQAENDDLKAKLAAATPA